MEVNSHADFTHYQGTRLDHNNDLSRIQEEDSIDLAKISYSYVPGLNESYSTVSSFNPQHVSSNYSSQCVLNRSDGSTIVVTPEREHRHLPEKPVTEKKIKYLRIFSIISIFLFPPTGLAALYFAFKSKKDFGKGVEVMDYMAARKNVIYTERFLIASVVCGILMYTLIFSVIGRAAYGHYKDDSRSNQVVK